MPSELHSSSELTGTMQAALFYAPGDVRYEEMAIPTLEAGELLVKVDTGLTCGTDVKCYRRGHPVLLKNFPSPFGHEFAGTVAAVGEGVNRFQVSDRVVAANSAPCYQCYFCHKGNHNLCENLDLLNGAYADYLKIPRQIVAHNTYRVPEHIPFEAAAFTEPLAVSLRGVEIANVTAGDHVAVLGLGPIGQLIVKLCKWKGAQVTAMARNPEKLAMAQHYGRADQIVNLRNTSDVETIRAQYTEQGRGFDVVIEAIGLPELWEKSVGLARKGGRVNLFGGCPSGSTVTLDTRRLHYDEIMLVSSFHHTPFYFKKALELICNYDIDPMPLITKVMPMARFETALQSVEAGEAMKIALKPGLVES